MKKLMLDALHVESFATTTDGARARGTVAAHAQAVPGDDDVITGTVCTYDPRQCGETNYMDCTFGCSYNTGCKTTCWTIAEPTPPADA